MAVINSAKRTRRRRIGLARKALAQLRPESSRAAGETPQLLRNKRTAYVDPASAQEPQTDVWSVDPGTPLAPGGRLLDPTVAAHTRCSHNNGNTDPPSPRHRTLRAS